MIEWYPFPTSRKRPEVHLKSLLAYAVLAPSSHNSQPWRFIVDGPTIAVCADRVRACPSSIRSIAS